MITQKSLVVLGTMKLLAAFQGKAFYCCLCGLWRISGVFGRGGCDAAAEMDGSTAQNCTTWHDWKCFPWFGHEVH